jgi:tRNA threonylcarbamoyl adenosine modification protein YjeE
VIDIATAEAMEAFGERVAGLLRAGDVLCLTGPLGTGKTTFTRGLGRALGVRGTVTSPTFVVARTHARDGGPALVHIDAYRLQNAAELEDLDIDWERSISVVEWGHDMLDSIVDSWLEIVIDRGTDPELDGRVVTLHAVGDRGAELANEIGRGHR